MTAPSRQTSRDYRRPYRTRAIALANRVGRMPAALGLPSLRPDALLRAAAGRVGLADFGDDSFREPLEVLVESIEREARLTPVGRIITRERLVGVLANRLRVTRAVLADPGVEHLELAPPVVIVGLQRTGTTLLHRLLASDPAFRWLTSWEALYPAPFTRSARGADPRVRAAERAERALAYLAPDFFAVHPVEAHAPEEEVLLLDNSLRSTVPEATLRVPTFSRWLEEQDQRPAYRTLKLLLRLLSRQRGPRAWLLKTPHHLEWLDVLFETFPGARVIWTHRDPSTTLGSFCSMIAHGRGVFSDEVDPHEIGRGWGQKVLRMVERAMDVRDRHGASHFHDVRYEELVADPIGEVAAIYTFLGRELTPGLKARVQAARLAQPRHRYGRHRYELADFGLRRDQVRERFARYLSRFDLG